MASLFEADIASLKGVGPKRAELFRKLGAPTVGDLLRLYPRAYEDWRDAVPIRNTGSRRRASFTAFAMMREVRPLVCG